jgi:hypothetical protein
MKRTNRLYGYDSNNFIAYFYFVGWDCLSLGMHICLSAPNIEIHIPFGFIRIGRKEHLCRPTNVNYRTFKWWSNGST